MGFFELNNEALNNLTSIEDLDPGSIENIKIVGNEQLSECHVQSICDYLVTPNGIVEIHELSFSVPCQKRLIDHGGCGHL